MASSFGTTLSNIRHDIFVSYCVEDTGTNFTSHLKSAFDREGIIAIIDDKQEQDVGESLKKKQRLDKGEEISESLSNKISESLVLVLVFSENYGGSPGCLNEVVEIIRCMQENRRYVLPVFRGVEPTHVRKQEGAFGEAFQKMLTLNQQLKVDKEEKWRSALVEAANLSGWDSNNTSTEAQMVNKVVERIKEIVNMLPSHDISDDGFVGITRVKEVESLLRLESKEDVQSIGIWGTGGIGKTTIVKKVYFQIMNKFDGACFLENVGQRLDSVGSASLCKDMLLELLGSPSLLGPLSLSTHAVQRALGKRRCLIVLDDVTDPRKLKSLVKPHKFYGLGSRIILISRDKQVLKNCYCKEEHIYGVEKLNYLEAFTLFEFHAFKQQPCPKDYIELSKEAVSYANGLPLALEVLGCNLYDKDIKEWVCELKNLKENPDRQINNILMISYDGLDRTQKEIFIDIACVFVGWRMDEVERILDACNFFPTSGIRHLWDKALITISHGILGMHNLLQQMGQNIVIQECEENPGRLSRIWKYKDFHDAMTQNKLTEKVEVISVDLYQATNMVLILRTFEKLSRLRVLNLYDHPYKSIEIHLPKGFRFKSDKLAYLRWDHYPLKSLPDKFNPNHLVELNLRSSSIVHLRSGEVEPNFPTLKVMDLSFSKDLISLPNFFRFPNLERLDVKHCDKLRELPSSIQRLSKLQYLNVSLCYNLTKLPELPPKIMELDLLFCEKLRSLPESIGELRSLRQLNLHGCSSLRSLPESLGKVQSLWYLSIRDCAIRSLPSTLCHLSKKAINLQGLGLVSLGTMDLSYSGLESLPTSIKQLSNLYSLRLDGCKNLTSMPDLPSSLTHLYASGCTSLRSLGRLFGGHPSFHLDLELNLVDSINLDKDSRIRSVTAARSRIEAMVASEVALENDEGRGYICIPGGRVPEWVEYREEGSSIKLKLLGCCALEDLSDLIFGIVILPGSYDMTSLLVSCKCLFVTREIPPLQVKVKHDRNMLGQISLQSGEEHVVLWYQNIRKLLLKHDYRYDDDDEDRFIRRPRTPVTCSEVTFEFQFTFEYFDLSYGWYRKKIDTVLRCGVTPLGRNFETKRGKRFHVIKI